MKIDGKEIGSKDDIESREVKKEKTDEKTVWLEKDGAEKSKSIETES